MANPQLNIGNLDFDDIKSSLKSYLSTQDTFKDYDFEGSALSTLLDVLSYNTLYYAFYSNMIANEMFLDTAQKLSSVISLAKPLGYVVPGSRSAEATFQVTAGRNGESIPKYTLFTGNDETGRSFNFYNIETQTIDGNGFAEFNIYQGSKLFEKVNLTTNEERTKAFIGRTDIEIRSIEVTVQEPGEDEVVWSLSTATNENLNSDSKVYFLERTDAGFFVVFGGNYSDGISVSAGKPLPENSVVRVSYITSSGEIGNGVSNFSTTLDLGENAIFRTVSPSSGGAVEPDLDAVKFFAPKWFSAQDRVVTKNDAIAILSRDFVDETTDSDFRISVWGGEENDPPYYGRFFVSILNEDENADPVADGADIENAIETLKSKCVVTVLPESIDPVVITFDVNLNGTFSSGETSKSKSELEAEVAAALNSAFGGQRSFNKSVTQNDVLTTASAVDSAITIETSEMTSSISREFSASDQKRFFYLKNPIKKQNTSIPLRSIQTTPTEGYDGFTDLQLVDFPSISTSTGWSPLYLARRTGNSFTYVAEGGKNVVAGRVNYERGIIEVYKGMLVQPFTMTVTPKNIGVVGKQELVVNPRFSVTLTVED